MDFPRPYPPIRMLTWDYIKHLTLKSLVTFENGGAKSSYPQIPSSRAFGQAAVYSLDEYMTQAPADRSQWKIIPIEPRVFSATMRDALALLQKSYIPVPFPVGVIVLGRVQPQFYDSLKETGVNYSPT